MASPEQSTRRIIRLADLRPTPWSGDGSGADGDAGSACGKTREIAAGDGWRLALTMVDRAGALPAPGPGERVATLVDGELVALRVGTPQVEHALERYRPFPYDGGTPAEISLPTGPGVLLQAETGARDTGARQPGEPLGVRVTIMELSKTRSLPLFGTEGGAQFGVLLEGRAVAHPGDGSGHPVEGATADVEVFDAVRGSEEAPVLTGRGFVAVVDFTP
ncbi:hypothetical protein [Zhihengliuella sp.]|uniref:hypothetical protein n=1 Tax=Zhihengliuella sp. TaxID=1954483 RepID=UPI002811136F|nr:hypothetical protein [Zhihengliuella sp.]